MIIYIDCLALMTTDGVPKPQKIFWEDGRIFEIDKILDIRKKASTKGGGAGLRYTVKINGYIKYLFLNSDKWFLELP